MADSLTPEQRSYCMSRIRSKNTGIELAVRKRLHRKGYRYRLHYKDLIGSPDIVFPRSKVAIFIDGDFWHGYDFESKKHKLQTYWADKIQRNIDKDMRYTKELKEKGWKVLRFWQHEIKKDIDMVIKHIEEHLTD
jgi:DNA mismatch endonuclease (patch repair protein)